MLGDPPGVDPLTTAIDRFAKHAAASVARGVCRVRMWLREQDPAARLGLEIIVGAQRQMIDRRLQETLAQIPAIASGRWWLAPALRPADRGPSVHMVAAGGRLVAIEMRPRWRGSAASPAVAASLLTHVDPGTFAAVSIVAVSDQPVQSAWSRTEFGERVLIAPIDGVAELVERQLDGARAYSPEEHSGLSRVLHGARVAAAQRSIALGSLGRDLDARQWVVAPGVHPPHVHGPIDVLAIGPTGIYVCEVAAADPERAANDAVEAACAVALNGSGLNAEVIPVVLCQSGARAHQLQLNNGQRAWVLPLDSAAAHLRQADRAGVGTRRLRRLRRPAPGWRYGLSNAPGGLVYEVRYDISRHFRALAHDD
jgi:hypothetical protein